MHKTLCVLVNRPITLHNFQSMSDHIMCICVYGLVVVISMLRRSNQPRCSFHVIILWTM